MNLIDFNNGTITVTTTGGTAPYSFLLQQNGSTFNYGGSNFVNPISSSSGTVVFGNAADTTGQSGLPAGDYTCQITDSNGCIINTPTLTVQQNVPATTTEAPTYTVTINPVANPSDVFGQYPMVFSGLSAGDSFTIPAPTFGVSGHNFLGYDTYSGTPMAAPEYQPGDVITISGDTNLYARYQLIPTTLATTLATTTEATTTQLTVTLTANANPSDIVPAENFTTNYNVSFGSTYTFPAPTFSHSQGWIFSGWSPFPNGGTPTFQPGDTTVINNSGTFYAQWTIPTTTIAPTTEATTTEATTTEATTTEATTTEATTTEATTTEATTTEATTTEATTTEATTTEATTTEATTTEATTTEATTTEATTTEATTTEATTTEATTTEATTTEATTTEATTTEATTTEATTTVAQDETTFYHFHMGGTTYPFTDLMGSGNAFLIGDTSYTQYPLSDQANVDLIMTDLIDNSNGTNSTCTPGTFEFAGPIDGTNGCNGSWSHNLTGGDDYYYLAVPNNASFNVNLVTDGLLQESCSGTYNASERRGFTYNGESYWLYKMLNGTGSIAKTFNFK